MEWQYGIDTIAHKTTLENDGKTIAVLGCGFNNIFPEENIELYHNIIRNGGLIVSEYPPDIKAESQYFVARNRIVSGISMGILIIEAVYRSGTSITARFASEQDKKVFVLPHEINNKNGVGTNQLIRKGAILVTSTREIIDEFEFLEYKKIHKKQRETKKDIMQKTKDKQEKEIMLKNKDEEYYKQTKKIKRKELKNRQYQKVYDAITTRVISIDEIYKKIEMELSEVNQILFFLEIEGYIEKVAGGYRCILNKE